MVKGCNIYLSQKDIDGLCVKYRINYTQLINIGLNTLLKEGINPDIKKETNIIINQTKDNNYKSGSTNYSKSKYNMKKEILLYYLEQYNINPKLAQKETIDKYNINPKYLSDIKTLFKNEIDIPDLRSVGHNHNSRNNKVNHQTVYNYYLDLRENYHKKNNKYPKDTEIIDNICNCFDISIRTFKSIKSDYKILNRNKK